jgi:prepilin-type N-terminal cleavage/methylation domain-containing protein
MTAIGNRYKRGFSLLELIVAIVLAGLAFAVLFSSMSTSLRNVGRLTTFEHHVEQAKSKLAELELVSGLHPGDHSEGDFEDGTRWRFEVFPYILPPVTLASVNAPSVVRVVLTLEWQGRSGRQSWAIERYRTARTGLTTTSLQQQIDALR